MDNDTLNSEWEDILKYRKDLTRNNSTLSKKITEFREKALEHYISYIKAEVDPSLPKNYDLSKPTIYSWGDEIIINSGILRRPRIYTTHPKKKRKSNVNELNITEEFNEEKLAELLNKYAEQTPWVKKVRAPFIPRY